MSVLLVVFFSLNEILVSYIIVKTSIFLATKFYIRKYRHVNINTTGFKFASTDPGSFSISTIMSHWNYIYPLTYVE